MTGFGRSNSLSINTGSGGGLFGNNNATQAQQGGQPQSSGGLFGSTQQTQQQPQSASLFGGQNQASQPSGGLFGNKPATTAPASGGLFGSSTAQSSQPSSGGLFGGALGGNTQNQAPNTAQSGGLFGNSQAKPSLFGASTQQTTTATPSLFGNNTSNQQNQNSTPSLFGSTQQQQAQPQQQNTLFGGMNSQNRSGTLGGSTLGGNQMSGSAQPVQMTLDSIRGTTRFNDLHPELQTLIQQFDEGIQRKINFCSQIRETLPKSEADISTIAPDVAYIETRLSTVEVGLDNDSANIAYLKDLVKKDAEDATLSFRAIENQRLPAQFHYRNTNLTASSAKTPATSTLDDDDPTKPVDLMGYFNRRTDELGNTLNVYKAQIREIESHLRTMEAGTVEKAQQLTGSRSAPRDQRRELVEALKAIEGAILDSAKRVGQVRDDVTKATMGNVGATLL